MHSVITFQLTSNIVCTCINNCMCPLFLSNFNQNLSNFNQNLSNFNQNWSLLVNFNINHQFSNYVKIRFLVLVQLRVDRQTEDRLTETQSNEQEYIFDNHRAMNRIIISIVNPTSCTSVSNLFWNDSLHVSDGALASKQTAVSV